MLYNLLFRKQFERRFTLKKNQINKFHNIKKDEQINSHHMQLIGCNCGAKILVVPDVAAMARAVKNHLSKDKNANEQYLIEQIFKVASSQA
jgi:hypothetical protein